MYKLLILVIAIIALPDVYNFSLPGNGNTGTINLSDFRGKKILLVNTASNSLFTPQYAKLEQLSQQYQDSLVIIAVPSNDFGHESGTDAEIRDFVQNNYHIHYLLASKASVAGAGQSDLYKWLTTGAQNGVVSSTIKDDFQKYLIGSDGHLIGYFTGAIDPLDSLIVTQINAK